MLSFIHESLKGRIIGWFARQLSMGGKEVLLKAIAMALPVFAMSVFKLPKSSCDSLSAAMANLWWDAYEHKQKFHWISWKKLCLSKEQGGLGFKDIETFNQALLAKQAWRILHEPDCLLAKLLKSRYFNDGVFLEAPMGYRPSFAWRSVLHGRDLLATGLRRMVGNGRNIRVWIDPWILEGTMRVSWIKNRFFDVLLRVSDLIDFNRRDWRIDKLRELFVPMDVERILKSKPLVSSEDYWAWRHNYSGEYSVKSGYWLASQRNRKEDVLESLTLPSLNPLKAQIWKIKTLPKIKNFMWKALSGAVPVTDNICARGMKIDPRCQVCGVDNESVNHALFICPLARQIWALTGFPHPRGGFDLVSIYSNINFLLKTQNRFDIPPSLRRSYLWILWLIWKNRNKLTLEGKSFCPMETVGKIREESDKWFLAQEVGRDQDLNYDVTPLHRHKRWEPPPRLWLKCNLSSSWNKSKELLGAAWVLRNEKGEVLSHSRRAFKYKGDKMGAKFLVSAWTIESMLAHKVNKVIFASVDSQLLGAILRPRAWPSFRYYAVEILALLAGMEDWRLKIETVDSNRGAAFIASSVTDFDFVHSYVAQSHPSWLQEFFDSERVLSSA